MDTVIQQLFNAAQLGAVYALIALGYSMVYGIIRLINFAHGDIFMLGGFIGLLLSTHFGWMPFYLLMPLAMLLTALAATKGFQGVTGSITYAGSGDPVKGAVVIKVENGKFVFDSAVNP